MGLWCLLVVCLTWVNTVRGQNAPENSVFYDCNNTYISLAVKVDPLGTNRRLDPTSLTLGKCPVSSITALFGYFVFEYQLGQCGFNRMAFGNFVKFSTNLVYMPTQIAANLYSQPFSVLINCLTNSSLTPPIPQQAPVFLQAYGMGNLNFAYQFMNDDFSGPSDVKEFLLGSPINLELSVTIGYHMPLRLFVDEGIVTPNMDSSATQKYDLIANHGCFVDGKVANSRFVKQDPINNIWLTFPAMKFVDVGNEIYLTFKLVAWDPKEVTELRKACSYSPDTSSADFGAPPDNSPPRWELLGSMDNNVCACCDGVCNRSSRKKRGVNENENGFIHTMVLGPFKVHSPNDGNESRAAETGFVLPPAVGALFLELAVLLLMCIGVILYGRSKQREIEERDLVTNEEPVTNEH